MKIFALLGLVVSSLSFATSIRPVALQSVDMPLHLHHDDSTAKIIRVALDGEVFGGTCGVRQGFSRPGPGVVSHPIQINYNDCEWKTVKFMAPREMRQITRLTNLARRGEIQHPDPRGIHCLAIPMRSIKMDADNGSVFLKAGSFPCGFQTYNKSQAAQKLVQELNTLRGEYNKLVD